MAVRQRISPEEYLDLPEEKPYLEYINGEVVPKVAPDIRHLVLADEVQFRLHLYRREVGGLSGPEGRVEFDLVGEIRFLLPDVAYWAPDRPIEGTRAMLPPTLAVEIRSPGQPMDQMRARARFFLANGVDACWIVDAESRTVETFDRGFPVQLLREADILESPALPGFSLSLVELFAALDR